MLMISFNDELYNCFEEHLYNLRSEKETHAEFVCHVVDSFWSKLKNFGHISSHFETEIREDLEDEVMAMLRKRTYGYFNLDQYRKSLRICPKSKKNN